MGIGCKPAWSKYTPRSIIKCFLRVSGRKEIPWEDKIEWMVKWVVELDAFKTELLTYNQPLVELRDSL